MKIKRYLSLVRLGMMDMLQWRMSIFMAFIGNIIYLAIIYSLWKAIYASSPVDTVNGMTFTDTLIYLVLAMTVFNVLNLFLVWEMGYQVQSGNMVLNLLKPMEYRSYMLFSGLGNRSGIVPPMRLIASRTS